MTGFGAEMKGKKVIGGGVTRIGLGKYEITVGSCGLGKLEIGVVICG